mgnify:CR=1 FL=1
MLAAGTGDVALTLPDTYSLETLAVGEGTGAVSLAGTVSRLEVTGEARTISIDSSLDTLVVSGSGNTISVKRGCTIGQIVILGTDNVLTLDGTSDTLLLAGRDNTVRGSGRVTEVQLNTRYYTLTVSKKQLIPWTGYDIKNVESGSGSPCEASCRGVVESNGPSDGTRRRPGKAVHWLLVSQWGN